MLCTFQPLAKGDLVDHVLHTLIMYKDCLGIMKEQCKNSRLPHLLMIVVHGETLWSPAPQPMDDDDDDDDGNGMARKLLLSGRGKSLSDAFILSPFNQFACRALKCRRECTFSPSCHYVFCLRTELMLIVSRFFFFFSYTLLLFRILHVWCLDFIEILGSVYYL